MREKTIQLKRKYKHWSLLLLAFVVLLGQIGSIHAKENALVLDKAPIDLTDLPSMQRGAQLFMNECSGCHALKYVRYSTLAKEIGIVDAKGQVLEQAVKDNLMFVGDKITDPIKSAMTKEEGAAWFGVAPPDLSLVTRFRSADWVYTYLRSFYLDPRRPWGVNNKLFPDVAMPDVLFNLRARLRPEEYDAAILDLVNFLSFMGEPVQVVRQRLGIWILLFLGVFLVFACLLKREYWKDIQNK
jgi:ubiquinol-cytochrome c reductase cytochrome c1 subunit